MTPVSAVVLTHNEEANLEPCLRDLSWADEIFVVDSGSTDRTLSIARACGARTVSHPFETHARQWMWALNHLPLRHDWVLGLDADQRVTEELRREIERAVARPGRVDGYYIKRRHVFQGRWIRHGGYYPKYLLKLFRRSRVRLDPGELVDHHFYVPGPCAKLRFDLIEENLKENDLGFWMEKHRRYADLMARQEMERGEAPPVTPSPGGTPDQRALWLKKIWRRLPLFARPVGYFVYRYFLRMGFLDGRPGLLFHFLHGFWFRWQVDLRIRALRNGHASAGD
jgi:glycosyltransferase involved in cell wall biosynthesis